MPIFSRWKHKRWFLREALAAVLFLGAAGTGILVYSWDRASYHKVLKITGGSSSGVRAQIAHRLASEARHQGLTLQVTPSGGSKEALEQLNRGELDLALVQGGLDVAAYSHVRQVAPLHIEPLHLLVKPELHQSVEKNLSQLRGKTVNVSNPQSGTHDLAVDVLKFAGLKPRGADGTGDCVISEEGYDELEARITRDDLPDAIFTVSDLPSPLARHLVARGRFQLVSLPFGEAFAIEAIEDRLQGVSNTESGAIAKTDDVARFHIYPTVIPAFTYGVEPATPPTTLATFGPRLLLVANEAVAPKAVRLVLEAVFSGDFAQFYHPPLDSSLLDLAPEHPWHPGTDEYREHHKQLLAGDMIDLMEKGTSLAGAVIGALFFLWQWVRQHNRRKQEMGFESYMVKVAGIEQQTLDIELGPKLDLKELVRLQVEVNRLKSEAISRFAEGTLQGETLFSGFVTHANDARNHLTRLILHERDNIENRAQSESRSPQLLWKETMSELAGSETDQAAATIPDDAVVAP